ncbi:hypothetical protein BC938DRAFT_481217 [Jimgerdemannia flammicorona]|uniref:Uncharacterized protein n=1 Tax=Jimgerdemannia flammicorona TaxID=994334 RepID=A0A433QGV7_9FUNG|nr:hypothetical protein BC938DRAFT_481217 [Jimgerdemannia flammicorona]
MTLVLPDPSPGPWSLVPGVSPPSFTCFYFHHRPWPCWIAKPEVPICVHVLHDKSLLRVKVLQMSGVGTLDFLLCIPAIVANSSRCLQTLIPINHS